MKTKSKTLLLFGLALGMMAATSAQGFQLLVPDFRVNQGPGTASASAPAVAATTTNEFIVTWPANGAIYALRLDSRGNPLGEEFRVDQGGGVQSLFRPAVAVDGNNNFMIAWVEAYEIYPDWYNFLYARRYDPKGNPSGDVFLVSESAGSWGLSAHRPTMAVDQNNTTVIVWYYVNTQVFCGDNGTIYARSYDASGNPLGNEFFVNQDTGCDQTWYPALAVDSLDRWIIPWEDFRDHYLNGHDIYARRFDSTGSPIAADFRVDQAIGAVDALFPSVAADPSNNFIITWEDRRNGDADIYMRCYDSDANPLNVNVRVDVDLGTAESLSPSIATQPDGSFLIVWTDYRSGNSDIFVRRFQNCYTSLGGNFRLDQGPDGASAEDPSLAVAPSGVFLFAWSDNRNGTWDIYASIWGEWVDSDGDGLSDFYEQRYSCLQANTVDDSADPDGDGYTNLEEYQQGTDPCVADCTDGDGDGYGPGCASGSDCDDTDLDNWMSCATCADSDGDTYYWGCDSYTTRSGPDCEDHAAGIFPGAPELCDCMDNQCPGDVGYGLVDEGCTPDADCDGLEDDWEKRYDCMDPTQADALSDYDADGLSNHAEYGWGLDPCEADTDDDDLEDGEELDLYGTDPRNRDTDGDGYDDGTEVKEGTDPLDPASFPKEKIASTEWSYPEGGSPACGQLTGSSPSGLLVLIPILAFGLIRLWRNFSRDQ